MNDPQAITDHSPGNFEKTLAVVAFVWFLAFGTFLILRNVPPADPNLAWLWRLMFSAPFGFFGSFIGGYLQIKISLPGVIVRAVGGAALFVTVYLLSPSVMPSLRYIKPIALILLSKPIDVD